MIMHFAPADAAAFTNETGISGSAHWGTDWVKEAASDWLQKEAGGWRRAEEDQKPKNSVVCVHEMSENT